MKTNNTFLRGILTAITVFATSLAMVAQTSMTKHIVARGETLHDIATRYGTTTEKIINSNPQAAQFIYVGMELEIPVTPTETVQQPATIVSPQEIRAERQSSNVLLSTVETPQLSAQSTYSSAPASRFGIVANGYFESDIIRYGANINLEGITLYDSGFGIDFSIGWDVFWEPKFELGSFVCGIGPAYGYKITETVDFYLPVKLLAVFTSYTDPNTNKDKTHLDWGCRVNPFICIRSFSIGLYGDFAKGSSFGLSFGFLFP